MWATIIAVIAAAVIGIGSIFYMGSDNAIEEYSEKIIEDLTGIEDLDLSPWEEENIETEDVI